MTEPSVDIPDLPEIIQTGPLALCSLADIAGVLGFSDATALTSSQRARIPYLLAKLCSLFRREAGREFSPGRTTVDMMTLAGRIPLPDPLGDNGFVEEVVTRDGTVLDSSCLTIRGDTIWIKEPSLLGRESPSTGTVYTVTYTHDGEVPWDVRAAMASAVARYLTIDPNSAVAQSTFLSAGEYHQRIAGWVADVVRLDPEDIKLARSHRAIPVNLIVHNMGGYVAGHTDWSQWVWGGVTVW